MGIDNKVLNSFLSICKYIVKYKRCQHIIFTDNVQPSCVIPVLEEYYPSLCFALRTASVLCHSQSPGHLICYAWLHEMQAVSPSTKFSWVKGESNQWQQKYLNNNLRPKFVELQGFLSLGTIHMAFKQYSDILQKPLV